MNAHSEDGDHKRQHKSENKNDRTNGDTIGKIFQPAGHEVVGDGTEYEEGYNHHSTKALGEVVHDVLHGSTQHLANADFLDFLFGGDGRETKETHAGNKNR